MKRVHKDRSAESRRNRGRPEPGEPRRAEGRRSQKKSAGLWQKMSSFIWLAAALFFLGLAVYAGLLWDSNATISEMRFSGMNFTAESELLEVIDQPVGLKPDSIDFSGMAGQLASLPYIIRADFSVDVRGRMTVEVTERQPLAMLAGGSGHAYIDRDGVILPPVTGYAVNVPILHGFPVSSAGDTLSGEAFEQVNNFLSQASQHELGWITISEVAYSREEGVKALTQENGVKLLFGRERFDEKLRYWERFYSEVIRTEGIDNFSVVDLRYRNQIVTR